jgi:5-methylcytosine-specific restriction endonuclease McrA
MEMFGLMVVCGIAGGLIARHKGRSVVVGVVLGGLLNIIGVLIELALPSRRSPARHARTAPVVPAVVLPLVPPEVSRHIPVLVRRSVMVRDGGRCQRSYCGITELESLRLHGCPLEYDHIIPFSLGGTSDEGNIQLLCKSCNGTKSNKFTAYDLAKLEALAGLYVPALQR